MMMLKGYWVDENNNFWDSSICTKEEAKKASESLINCRNCEYCEFCKDCEGLTGAVGVQT